MTGSQDGVLGLRLFELPRYSAAGLLAKDARRRCSGADFGVMDRRICVISSSALGVYFPLLV